MATKETTKKVSIMKVTKKKKIGAGDAGLLSNKIRKVKSKG